MNNVYKYYDQWGLDVLRNLELKITPPNQLNDVFEFSPHVISSNPSRMAKKILSAKTTIRESYREDRRTGFFKGSERDYRIWWKSRRPTLKKSLADAIVAGLPASQARFPKLHSQYTGVLCLTSNSNSVVMWSHYANKHQGIVIEFDKAWTRFAEGNCLRPVNYTRRRPVWDETVAAGSEAEKAQYDAVVFHKNEEWIYEKELSQLYLLSGLTRRPLEDGTTGYFLPVPSKIIMSVRIGMFCASESILEIKKALKASCLSHVILSRAIPHGSEFSMTTAGLKAA